MSGGVVVVGAGLAGLSCADTLARAGVEVEVVEATSGPGGRVRAIPDHRGGQLEVGGEFIATAHTRTQTLAARLGLALERTAGRGPVRWRTNSKPHNGWRPPIPPREVPGVVRALTRLTRAARRLDPHAPWSTPAGHELDTRDVAGFLAAAGAGPATLTAVGAAVGGFATVPAGELSALQAAWWIRRAGSLRALAQSTRFTIAGGASRLPERLAAGLPRAVADATPVTAIHQRAGRVEVQTTRGTLDADAVVVAVPLPALRDVGLTPPLTEPAAAAVGQLHFGAATKLAVRVQGPVPAGHRVVLGGSPVGIAWRSGPVLSGIASGPAAAGGHDRLVADLIAAFDVDPAQVDGHAVMDWTANPYSRGSYITFAPGQLTRHAPHLATHHGRISFAAAERSSWPDSMEGAIESGQQAAHRVLAQLR